MSTLDDDIAGAVLLDGSGSLLDADDIPNDNQSEVCFSCDTPLVGLHCHTCGQKNDDLRRSLFSLGLEALGNITAFDARIWRTWAMLLTRPGRVARQYSDGMRTKWTSPVRAYLAMSILLFGFIAITQTQIVSIIMDVDRVEGVDVAISDLKPSDLAIQLELHMLETTGALERQRQDTNLELVNFLLAYEGPLSMQYDDGNFKLAEDGWTATRRQSDDIDRAVDIGPDGITPEQNPSAETAETNSKNSLGDDIVEGFIAGAFIEDDEAGPSEGTEVSQVVGSEDSRIVLNGEEVDSKEAQERGISAFKLFLARPEVFNNFLGTYLPRVMFFMMPFTMLLGAMFIRGRGNALLYDHLVHAAYIHAVFFFLLLIGLILARYTPIPASILLGSMAFYMLFYLPISLRVMFSRGMLKTVWTTYMVGFIYFIVMFIAIVMLITFAVVGVVEQSGTIRFGP